MNKIFHPCQAAVKSLAVVSLCKDDGFCQIIHIVFIYVADVVCNSCKGFGFVVSAAHAAACHNVEALQLTIIVCNNHKGDVLCVGID